MSAPASRSQQSPWLEASIVKAVSPAPDITVLHARLVARAEFSFQAGQYSNLLLEGFDPRAFSIASSPYEELLEFHVRNVGHGLSAELSNPDIVGQVIGISAAMGNTVYKPAQKPVLVLAGGLGIVPMKAIVQAALHSQTSPDVRLYWGVRSAEQAYLNEHFITLSQRHPQFFYLPVLETGDAGQNRIGHVVDAVRQDALTLSESHVYCAGPPLMIEAAMPQLLALGANKEGIFGDMF